MREVHSTAPVPIGRERLMSAVREVTWQEVPLLRRLTGDTFGGQRVEPTQPILDGFCVTGPYVRLERTENHEVVGLLVNVRQRRPVEGTVAADYLNPLAPGFLKILLGFSVAESGRVRTETRVAAAGRGTRVMFRLYWLVLRGSSGLIRRRWLKAIVRRASAR